MKRNLVFLLAVFSSVFLVACGTAPRDTQADRFVPPQEIEYQTKSEIATSMNDENHEAGTVEAIIGEEIPLAAAEIVVQESKPQSTPIEVTPESEIAVIAVKPEPTVAAAPVKSESAAVIAAVIPKKDTAIINTPQSTAAKGTQQPVIEKIEQKEILPQDIQTQTINESTPASAVNTGQKTGAASNGGQELMQKPIFVRILDTANILLILALCVYLAQEFVVSFVKRKKKADKSFISKQETQTKQPSDFSITTGASPPIRTKKPLDQ